MNKQITIFIFLSIACGVATEANACDAFAVNGLTNSILTLSNAGKTAELKGKCSELKANLDRAVYPAREMRDAGHNSRNQQQCRTRARAAIQICSNVPKN